MIKKYQLTYAEVKGNYESLRSITRELAYEELTPVLMNKKSQAILKSSLSFGGITTNCVKELKQWEMSGVRRVAWDWDAVFKVYKPEPKRFELAIWHKKHWLCSASIGKPTSRGGKLRLDYIESNPAGSPIDGLITEINIQFYMAYAKAIGAKELRINKPINKTVRDYYLSKTGFFYNEKENFCFKKV